MSTGIPIDGKYHQTIANLITKTMYTILWSVEYEDADVPNKFNLWVWHKEQFANADQAKFVLILLQSQVRAMESAVSTKSDQELPDFFLIRRLSQWKPQYSD